MSWKKPVIGNNFKNFVFNLIDMAFANSFAYICEILKDFEPVCMFDSADAIYSIIFAKI